MWHHPTGCISPRVLLYFILLMTPSEIQLLKIENEMFHSALSILNSKIKTLKIQNKHFSRIIQKNKK